MFPYSCVASVSLKSFIHLLIFLFSIINMIYLNLFTKQILYTSLEWIDIATRVVCLPIADLFLFFFFFLYIRNRNIDLDNSPFQRIMNINESNILLALVISIGFLIAEEPKYYCRWCNHDRVIPLLPVEKILVRRCLSCFFS